MREPYALVDGRPKLEDSFVLFLDILGSQAMSQSEAAQDYLDRLFDAVGAAHRSALDRRPETPYRLVTFTDHIVVGFPVVPPWDSEMALGSILTIAAYFQFELTRFGFTARGGIARGELFIGDDFAFGPGLVSAYEIERDLAGWARVVLERSVAQLAQQHLAYYGRVRDAPQDDEVLFAATDGNAFVNYLYVLREAEVEEDDYEREAMNHREMIIEGLKSPDPKVRMKYMQLAAYHDYFCSEYYPERYDFFVEPGRSHSAFRAFRDFVKGVGDR